MMLTLSAGVFLKLCVTRSAKWWCFRSAICHPLTRNLDQTDANTLAADSYRDDGVLDERVDKSVPNDIDDADQSVVVARGDPAEAESIELIVPVIIEEAVFKRFGM
nr:hypothetical protein [Pseudarthrobacter sp. AB1]